MHITQLMVIGVAAVGCALALAACGSSAGYNPAAATNPNTNSPLALSQCMHSHGIKSFPDPTNSSGGPGLSLATSPGSGTVIADGITFSGPAFDAAAKACAKLLPGGGGPPPPPTAQQKQQALEIRRVHANPRRTELPRPDVHRRSRQRRIPPARRCRSGLAGLQAGSISMQRWARPNPEFRRMSGSEGQTVDERSPDRRWRVRLLAGLALIIAVAIVVVVVENSGSSSPSASGSTGSTATGATTVQRRNLIETDTESGTLSYNRPQTVYNRLTGTITWLPQVGQVIKAGGTLYKVDGDPVLLMNGMTPAYRDLGPSDSDGGDIEQLNRNLVALGFNAANITVDDVWQDATTEGVDLLQESLGETETEHADARADRVPPR